MGNLCYARKDQGNDRRRGARSRRRRVPGLEALEQRKLLDASGPSLPSSPPASSNPVNFQNESMANEGQDLINLYRAYQQNPADVSGLAAQFPLLQLKGATVAIGVNGRGDFGALSSSLNGLGMQVIASSETTAEVDGYLSIAQLPAVAVLPQTLSAHLIYGPTSDPPPPVVQPPPTSPTSPVVVPVPWIPPHQRPIADPPPPVVPPSAPVPLPLPPPLPPVPPIVVQPPASPIYPYLIDFSGTPISVRDTSDARPTACRPPVRNRPAGRAPPAAS